MSNFELTEDDKKQIEKIKNNNPVLRFLRNRDAFTFGPGDYLIRMVRSWKRDSDEQDWAPEMVSGTSAIPKKYLCVYEDEFGIKYIKALSSKGKQLPYVIALTEFDEGSRFQLDPDYADHILMGEERFNVSARHKEERKTRDKITRMNKKIAFRHADLVTLDEQIKKLKPGDKVWWAYNIPDAADPRSAREVVKVEYIDHPEIKNTNRFGGHRPSVRPKTWMITCKYLDPRYTNTTTMITEQLQHCVVFFTEPYKYETL